MGRHVVIVDREPSRRDALRAALALAPGEVREMDDPARLPARAGDEGLGLALLDLGGPEEEALDALRRMRARPGLPSLPVIALVPVDRPDLRLAALRAGAEEATDRDTAPRVLQARLRSLLRHREALHDSPAEVAIPLSHGLAEGATPFVSAPSSRRGDGQRLRLALLSPAPAAGPSPVDDLALRLGAEAIPLRNEGVPSVAAPRAPDLVVVDGLGLAGDLAQGAALLASIADLRGRPATRDAATLVLLPACAVETAALALDLGAGDVAVGPVGPEEIALRARALLGRRAQAERQRDQIRSQLRAALTDPLTGLHNLHHADPELRRMAESTRRDGGHLAVLMLDIDHFKSFNDRYGHATGNRVLIEVGRRLRSGLRAGDLLARIGGEEFLAALPGATLDEACATAERLRRAVADRPFVIDLGHAAPAFCVAPQSFAALASEPSEPKPLRVRVTLSIGVAAAAAEDLRAGLTPDDLLARADGALYAAKASGRDAVMAAPAWPQAARAPLGDRVAPPSPGQA
ncbi:hypothetical protein Rumeso_00795 [Rubellimicrobium mesophilum DSM 19309]|uniref:diguanylate cyclase n=1 Tax=Rubellimicrobium mesophilum DSM 19309 TaxID=442562 RepID=A0A017HV64_9RHOB|nr:diguanylate cyclase [Rubellimicrobium mesophilum]EYD77629.1 hypothetical protein Rumeso_00795 [Rubellimicrobium mesophilum DSM 19309]